MQRPKPIRKVGPLEVIEIPGTGEGPNVVVLHGYGDTAQGLLPISNLLRAPANTTWYFVNGPLKVTDGSFVGRAWFPLSEARFESMTADERDMSNETPEGMKKAREQVFQFLSDASIPISKTLFMGFSQGAMLATDVALRSSQTPLGLAILSGSLLNSALWLEKARTKTGLPFFQSHGEFDEILGIRHARSLAKVLQEGGLKGKLLEFKGGHEIPQTVVYELNKFLTSTLNQKPRVEESV